jgi:hypothetical protein
MFENDRISKLASILAAVALLLTAAGTSSAHKRVTGAAGSTDLERIDPILIGETFVYSVKMLCGTVLSDFSLRQFPSASDDVLMAPGTYLSAVNYHNPGPEEIEVENTVVVRTGPTAISVVGITPANWMGHLDCGGFLSNLNVGSTPAQRRALLKSEFVEGFFVLRSHAEIAVTGVYTFKNVEAPSFIVQDLPVEPPRAP